MIYTKFRRPRLALLSSLMVAVLFCAMQASAQTTTGSVYGSAADSSGAVIPNAAIVLNNVETNAVLATKTSDSGAYVFPVVDPGTYKVTATMPGFSSETLKDLRLSANQNINASFILKAGSVDTIVEVEAGTTLVDTRESQLGQTIDQKQIQDLPLVGRSAYALVQLVPGITKYAASAQIGDSNGTEFSTNGIRPNFNSFYLDGAFDTSFYRGGGNVIPNPDALQEFRILTTNFDAEFGRYPGAVVNAITRSGTNTFHGTAYDYLRNNIFNAKNYFSTTGVSKLIYNVFGGGLGGPIVNDKIFFFGSYQGLRINETTQIFPSSITLPTAAERNGDFRQSTKKPNGPFCGTQYVICPTAFDKVSVKILDQYVPLGINGTSVAPQQSAPSPTRADQGTGRLDYQLSQAHKLQLTYFNSLGSGYNRTAGSNSLLDYSGITTYSNQSNYAIGDTWIASPRAVNSLIAFYSHSKTGSRKIGRAHV